jgi:hypothetical protein
MERSMDTPSAQDERLQRARKRVEELKGFYVHVLVFLAMNGVLLLLDLVSGGGYWFYWPALIWGTGLAAHAVAVVAEGGLFGPRWEERKLRKIMERDENTGSRA